MQVQDRFQKEGNFKKTNYSNYKPHSSQSQRSDYSKRPSNYPAQKSQDLPNAPKQAQKPVQMVEKTLLEIEEEKTAKRQKKDKKEERQICPFYLRGYCKFQDSCWLSHSGKAQYFREKKEANYQQKVKSYYAQSVPSDYSEFQKYLQRVYCDFKRVESVTTNDLEVLFILDCTASMTDQLEACKTEVKAIINAVKQQFRGLQVRVGVVAFRDHQYGAENLKVCRFTPNIESCVNFLTGLSCKAQMGNDYPEDIVGGMYTGLNLEWRAKNKYAILITDAPCHGRRYHSMSDNYPEGDPSGRTVEELIREYARRNIFFNCLKLDRSTDRMFQIMDEEYLRVCRRKIQIKDLGSGNFNFQEFTRFLTESISSSVQSSTQISSTSLHNKLLSLTSQGQYSQVDSAVEMFKKSIKGSPFNSKSLSKSQKGLGAIVEKDEIEQIEEEDDEEEEEEEEVINEEQILKKLEQLEDKNNQEEEKENQSGRLSLPLAPLSQTQNHLQTFSVRCHTSYIVSEPNTPINWKKPLIQTSVMQTKIAMATKPFAEGAMRYAFFSRDLVDNQDQVAKLPKKKQEGECLETMKKDIETHIICAYIVNDFNDRILAYQDTKLLTDFVSAFIYEFPSSAPYRYAFGENFISGKYKKYNNNAGWTSSDKDSPHSKIAATLSHFSWQLTQGYLLMSDLQGVGNLLTDPQLHCMDKERFGSGNLGLYGILLFFNSHSCNEYCEALGLVHPKEVGKLEQGFQLLADVKVSKNGKMDVQKVCELCREVYQLKYREWVEKRIEKREFWCETCTQKRNDSMKKGLCELCGQEYQCSAYYYRMKKSDVPVLCYPCRKQDRERMRKEIKDKGQYQEYASQKQ